MQLLVSEDSDLVDSQKRNGLTSLGGHKFFNPLITKLTFLLNR